ncbi:UNVERIFIED_CONTAM: hypothetical protein RMT77_006784 [Armadillidium vulgare]
MMRYESERVTAVMSRSRGRSRVIAARSRRCSSFSLATDFEDNRTGRKRSVSCSIQSNNKEQITKTAAFTWSPLPPRKGADKVCVALFCDDTWANMEEFEALIDSLPGNEMPTPSHSSASSTLKRRAKEEEIGGAVILDSDDDLDELTFFKKKDGDRSDGEEEPDHGRRGGAAAAVAGSSSTYPPMRPSTNPRDTPTRHEPLLQSPIRMRTTSSIGKEDLTLESLHDLGWLHQMEPIDQTILEAHIIWSILTLMVVLLACYSFQHHSL